VNRGPVTAMVSKETLCKGGFDLSATLWGQAKKAACQLKRKLETR
jgi:hypothetical protein